MDDLVPAVTTPAPAPAPAVDDGWASLGFSAAVPAPTPAPAPAPAEPTAQDYLSQLKQQQDAALLMQSDPRDQAYYEAQVAQAGTTVAAPPPVVRTLAIHRSFLHICLLHTRRACHAHSLLVCAQAATVPAPVAATVDPAKVEMLTGLGFSAEQARLALESSGGDADQAANMLFSAA
eukprot:COSAG02_NODE_2313_length_9157_cov_8.540946_3_plen_177_part_00